LPVGVVIIVDMEFDSTDVEAVAWYAEGGIVTVILSELVTRAVHKQTQKINKSLGMGQ